jgi:hypothetical protein
MKLDFNRLERSAQVHFMGKQLHFLEGDRFFLRDREP